MHNETVTRPGPVMADPVTSIVEKASTMEERLSGPFNPLESAGDEHTLRARFRTWQNNAAKGDERRFVERLALSGWTVEDALRSLRPVRLAEGAALPPWADTLQRMIRSIQSRRDATSAEKPAFLDAAKPEPFEELLVPFVRVAWEMLAEAEGERLSWLGERARRDLQRYCLKRLSRLSWQALELEYSAFRALDSDIARLFASRLRAHVGSESGRSVYLRFVENMFGGKYLEFLNEYSVLARLLAQAIDHWSAACGEFIRRYVQDREAIGEAILDGQAAGRIESLQLGLSDHHNGGRSVIIAELEGGRKVVYKPKPLQIPTAFLRLLNWLNERTDVPLDLKGMKLLDRGLYGWEEYIEHSPCKDHAEVQRYYYRAGAMLCLVYALDGTDFHGENIIACGEYPVLVDLETLLHPRLTTPFAEEKDGSAQMLAFDKVDRSVLSTLLLPIWKQLPNGGYALGGIFVHEDLGKVRARRLKEINSDGMSLKEQEIVVEPDHNAPVLNGRKVSIDAYLSDFVTGFQQMYETLLRHRDTLSDPAGPLAGFRGVPVRLVFRATSVYAKLLRQGLNPKFLRDGTDFALHFELLCRPALAHEERKRLWPIIRKEQQDMLRMDIPYFTMLTDRKEVEAGVGKWSEQLCETTCFERMMEKIRRLSAEDCRFQVSLIRGSMHARLAGVAHTAVKASFPDRKENPHRPPENIEVAAAGLDIAAEIAERLKAEMIEADDGTRTWIAPSLIHERYQYSPVGYDLYSGLSGIAMFFAALAKASGDPRYRQDALATLQMIRQDVRRHGQTVLNHMGIGGVGGFSSVIYAFAAVHRLIDAPDLLEDALEMVSLMTDGMIGQDRHFDVIQGSAGAIFALVALYDATRSEAVLHKASVCAGHLLRHRVEAANGLRVWKSGSFDRPLCGFSHGASGVAAALLRLYARTGDYALAAAAHEALAYERRLFRPDTDRWPDLRFAGEGREGLTDAWCHGAAGIGLARLEALRHVSPNEPDAEPYRAYRNELEKAVSIVRNAQWTGVTDAVCCGNMGRLEFLLAVSNQYSGSGDFPASADLPGVIRQHAEKMIVSYRKKGSFQFASHVQLEPPGFFQGLSGIGYQLLRILHPARLPSVLMFEI
jgi:type 2 lantibiotic biosynthesis protein LanM